MQVYTRIDFANTLRGFAALAVVVSHYYGVFWQNRAAVEVLTLAPALPLNNYAIPKYISWLHIFPLFNWGAYGVALFFIISGFVIPLSLQKMSSISFLMNRAFRIIPIYIVGFSLTLISLFISTKYFSTAWPFSLKEILIHYVPGIRDLMWSRSIDGIVWTLEIEMKFYLICAVSIVWFKLQSKKVFFTPVVIFIVALCLNQFIPHWGSENAFAWQLSMTYMTVSQYIIYMFIGVIFNYLYHGKLDVNKAYLGVGVLFCLFCIHWSVGPYSASISVAWSYAFALLTFTFAYSFPNLFKSNRLFDFFAKISYPLYVIHGVCGYVTLRIMLQIGIKAWVSLIIVTCCAIAISYFLHRCIELPFQKFGKLVVSHRNDRVQ